MDVRRAKKSSFSVIGKEGSTAEGEGFIQRLWNDANSNFAQIAHLAKKDAGGNPVGIWGAMSDLSRSFAPWEDGFSRGLYLAGVECQADAQPPEGWTRWDIPGYEYLYVQSGEGVFGQMLEYIADNGMSLAGAVHDFTCPESGVNYMFFPVSRLSEGENSAAALWEQFRAKEGIDHDRYEAWQFGDDPDRLAALVLAGVKTATASAAVFYELEKEPMPRAGEYSVILDSGDRALCVIRTTKVYVVPFDEVTAEQAYMEGEGDRSLDYWRQCHRDFFSGELAQVGMSFDEKMNVVCEEFELVYKPDDE